MIVVTSDLLRTLRLRSQWLNAGRAEQSDPAALLAAVCGVQAQEAKAAVLAVWVRGGGPTAADVERARVEERSIVRTWCMRGTIHLLATKELGWLLPLLGPLSVRKSARRYAELGLDEAVCQKAVVAIGEILGEEGALTRAELAGRLAERGIPTEGQAAYHLVRRAALEGVACFGPDRAKEPTYVPLDGAFQIGEALDREAALNRLARRYLEAFGPAGPEDLAVWSGLGVSESRGAFESLARELIEVEHSGSRSWMLESQRAWLDEVSHGEVSHGEVLHGKRAATGGHGRELGVRLLPAYDPFLLGYKGRDLILPKEYAKRIHPGGGLLRPVVLVGGRAAATWRLKRKAKEGVVEVDPFEPLSPETMKAIEREVDDLGRFLEVPVRVSG